MVQQFVTANAQGNKLAMPDLASTVVCPDKILLFAGTAIFQSRLDIKNLHPELEQQA